MAEAAALLAVARADLAHGRLEEAVASGKGALASSTKLDARAELEVYSIIVRALLLDGKLADASSTIASMASKTSDQSSMATAELLKAEMLVLQKKSSEAASSIRKAIDIFEKLQDKENAGRALLTQAKVHSLSGDSKLAVQASEAAVAIFNALSDDNGEASAWAGVMQARFEGGDYKGGISASFAAMALFGEIGDEIGEATVLLQLAQVQLKKSLHGEALAASLSALSHAQKKGASRLESTALDIAVKSYIALGQASEAVSIAKQGVASARLAGNQQKEARSLQSLARAHSADKYAEVALDCANEALLLAERFADKAFQAALLEDIARIHLAAGQLQPAKDAGDRAGLVYKELVDSAGLESVQALLASIAEAIEKEPERKRKEEEQYQLDREIDLLALRGVTDAISTRNEDEFKAKYEKLDECKTLTAEDWSQAFAAYADDETQGWIESTLEKHPGQRLRLVNGIMHYTGFRHGGMHYGPGFRLTEIACTNIDCHPLDLKTLNAGVLQLWNTWDYNPDDWEGHTWWHAGVLDCALQVGAVRQGVYIDDLTRWYEKKEIMEMK